MERLPTITEATVLIRNGQLGPLELVEHCLQRIQSLDPALKAWVRVDADGARREAMRQQDLLAGGIDLGPLQGIPLGIKDIIDVAGWPTEAGSSLLAGHVVDQDSAAVARLRQQGAILLGKTVTTEFAFLDPAETRNPWNSEHTPGGSSSGSAAAVAAEMCLAALGSQTGGSITRPASYCGICGLKPTHGRVDVRGVIPISRSLDHVGPMARSVADLRILLTALADWQPGRKPLVEPPKLFLIREYFLDRCDETIRAVTLNALDRFQQAGADLHSLNLPDAFQHIHAMHRCIMAVEAAETHFDSFSRQSDTYSSQIAALLEEGLTTFAVDYSLSLRHHHLFREQIARLLGEDRVAITPATMTPAPIGLGSTGDPAFNSPWSYAGVPTVTIPCGLSPEGLPCGLQLIGPADREDLLLDVAQWCEGVLDFQARPAI